MRRYKKRISRIVAVAMLFVFLIGNSNMVHTVAFSSIASRGKAGAKEYPLYVKGFVIYGGTFMQKTTARKLLL